LTLGPRQDDRHGTAASNSAATAAGSEPEQRSTQRPSSSATSAVNKAPSW
jgi:hypothetical protein